MSLGNMIADSVHFVSVKRRIRTVKPTAQSKLFASEFRSEQTAGPQRTPQLAILSGLSLGQLHIPLHWNSFLTKTQGLLASTSDSNALYIVPVIPHLGNSRNSDQALNCSPHAG